MTELDVRSQSWALLMMAALLQVTGCGGDDTSSSASGGGSGSMDAGASMDEHLERVDAAGVDASSTDGSERAEAGADDGSSSLGSDSSTVDGNARAEAGAPGPSRGTFQLTYYWVTAEDDFTGVADTDLYTPACQLLATVPAKFAASLRIEGTGRLKDGRVINVGGACTCATTPCYNVVDAQHPWGLGVQNRALVPFRSIAVDRTVIAYGTHVWIAELAGVKMPGDPPTGGFVHDGCVSADDTGGAIVGNHVDFFAGLRAYYTSLDATLGLASVTVHTGGTACP